MWNLWAIGTQIMHAADCNPLPENPMDFQASKEPPPTGGGSFLRPRRSHRVCRPQAAKKQDDFRWRRVRQRKYLSGCQCGICGPSAHKLCTQQTASPLPENPMDFQASKKPPPTGGGSFLRPCRSHRVCRPQEAALFASSTAPSPARSEKSKGFFTTALLPRQNPLQ